MQRARICYVLEFSIETSSKYELDLGLLRESVESIVKAMASAILGVRNNEREKIAVRVGKIDCDEAEGVTTHSCLIKIEMQNFSGEN